MKINLTPSQEEVIHNRGGQLLVSAAAGSGKTFVLVERILQRLREGANIEDFLVITYTNAAAAELRNKLQSALQKRIEEGESSDFHRQLFHLNFAHISTVHSYCSELLKEYAVFLQIPSDFRIAEGEDCGILKNRAMGKTLHQCYETMSPGFSALRRLYASGRNDKTLAEVIDKAYEKANTRKDPETWLRDCLNIQKTEGRADLSETLFGAELISGYQALLRDARGALGKMKEAAAEDEVLKAKYLPCLEADIALLESYLNADSWDALSHLGEPEFVRLTSASKCENPELREEIKGVRDFIKKKVKDKYQFFARKSSEHFADMQQSGELLQGLLEAVTLFSQNYRQEKLDKHLMDYADLEHETLRLLYGKDFSYPNAEARRIAGRFREVLVDEYQDSNSVQEAIFYALSDNGNRLFAVGDVKQSIYRFRLAEPRLFIEKYNAFADCRAAKEGEARKILLSNNFRSSISVLDAVNGVMEDSMFASTGGLRYTEAEALFPGDRRTDSPDQYSVDSHTELIVLDGDAVPGYDKAEFEAETVAKKIRSMVESKVEVRGERSLHPCSYGDFAILLRSKKVTADIFLEVLQKNGIPAFCEDAAESILDKAELRLLCSLVETLVNPRKDIPLVSLLMSPVFAFTADDLASCRRNKNQAFIDSLRSCESEKATNFLSLLGELRNLAAADGLSAAISAFLFRTNAWEVFRIMEGGEERTGNIAAFQAAIAEKEKAGLSPEQIVDFLDAKKKGEFEGQSKKLGNSVLITTIHKSKGLEYPIVILPMLSKSFNQEDTRDQILFDSELGIAYNAADFEKLITYPTAQKKAIKEKILRESASEELRILYVAMTRARDYLVMLYTEKKAFDGLETLWRKKKYFSPEAVSSFATSPGEWVLAHAMNRPEAGGTLLHGSKIPVGKAKGKDWIISCALPDDAEKGEEAGEGEEKRSFRYEDYERNLSFRYPYAALTGIPTKLTATQLKGKKTDAEISEGAGTADGVKQKVRSFFSPILSESSSAAETGTAMHLALQYLDYSKCTDLSGTEKELNRLMENGFLSPRQHSLVNTGKLQAFFSSELGKRVLAADRMEREFKFSVMKAAKDFFEDCGEEEIMLQGVADCAFFEGGELSILDYKTDRLLRGQEQERAESYRSQVEVYAAALSEIFACPVKDRILYFFDTGTAVML